MTQFEPPHGRSRVPPHSRFNLLMTIIAIFTFSAGCVPITPSPPIASQTSDPVENTLLPSLQVAQPTSVQVTATPRPSLTPTPFPLESLIDQALQNAGGHWNVIIQQVNGEILYSRNPDERILVASVIKLPVALLFLKSLERQNIPAGGLLTYLVLNGIDDISYADLLHGMLVYSDEDFTETLIEAIRANGLNPYMAVQEWDLEIDIYNRVSSTTDIARLWQGLYLGDYISAEGRSLLLELLSEVTDNDAIRLGVICAMDPAGCTFYNKRGTITAETLVVADSALITLQTDTGEQAYLITLFGSQGDQASEGSSATIANPGARASEPPTDYYRLNDAIAEVGQIFADYLGSR